MTQPCPQEESTLLSDRGPDGHADKDKDSVLPVPELYVSVRVTVSHIDVGSLLRSVFDGMDYICYKHKGKRTGKEHVHVLVWETGVSDKIRKRLSRSGYKGNETFSIKLFKNGLLSGIRYCAKEGTVPLTSGDYSSWIEAAPRWKDSRVESYMDKKSDVERDWQLTYSNLVPQACRFAHDNFLTEHSLKHVVREMMLKTKWRPCHAMYKGGVPPCYEEDFKVRLGRERTYEMDWWNNYQKYN